MVAQVTAVMMITQILDKARVWTEGTMTEQVWVWGKISCKICDVKPGAVKLQGTENHR